MCPRDGLPGVGRGEPAHWSSRGLRNAASSLISGGWLYGCRRWRMHDDGVLGLLPRDLLASERETVETQYRRPVQQAEGVGNVHQARASGRVLAQVAGQRGRVKQRLAQ